VRLSNDGGMRGKYISDASISNNLNRKEPARMLNDLPFTDSQYINKGYIEYPDFDTEGHTQIIREYPDGHTEIRRT